MAEPSPERHDTGESGLNMDAQSLISAVSAAVGEQLRPLLEQKSGSTDEWARKRKAPEGPNLKFKGNKLQYEFNVSVLRLFLKRGRILGENNPDVQKAVDLVQEGKDSISNRNKLIRIANRSVNGWATVDEYMSDELASDSDDEKRIRSAEERASRRKAKASIRRPFRGEAPSRGRGYGWQFGGRSEEVPAPGFQYLSYGYSPYSFQNAVGGQCGQQNQFANMRQGRGRGACWSCGRFGHWAYLCPNSKPSTSSKQ